MFVVCRACECVYVGIGFGWLASWLGRASISSLYGSGFELSTLLPVEETVLHPSLPSSLSRSALLYFHTKIDPCALFHI